MRQAGYLDEAVVVGIVVGVGFAAAARIDRVIHSRPARRVRRRALPPHPDLVEVIQRPQDEVAVGFVGIRPLGGPGAEAALRSPAPVTDLVADGGVIGVGGRLPGDDELGTHLPDGQVGGGAGLALVAKLPVAGRAVAVEVHLQSREVIVGTEVPHIPHAGHCHIVPIRVEAIVAGGRNHLPGVMANQTVVGGHA